MVIDIALQRIDELMRLAIEAAPMDMALANRYVEMATRLATRHRVRPPPELRRMVCRKCGSLLLPGRTSRVRVRQNRSPHTTVTCLGCGTIKRYGYSKGSSWKKC
jgi:ribonuclease P protein subunit RPR2